MSNDEKTEGAEAVPSSILLDKEAVVVGVNCERPNINVGVFKCGSLTSIDIPPDAAVILISELIHALPVGIEIDYEAIVSSRRHLLARNLRLGNLTSENIGNEISKLRIENRRLAKDDDHRSGLVIKEDLMVRDGRDHNVESNDPSSATASARRVERTVRSRIPVMLERMAQRPFAAAHG